MFAQPVTPQAKRLKRIVILLGVFVLAIYVVAKMMYGPAAQTLAYSAFYNQLEAGKIASVTESGDAYRGVTTDGTHFTTMVPNDPGLQPELRKQRVNVTVIDAQRSGPMSYLAQFAPFVLMALVLIFLQRRLRSRG